MPQVQKTLTITVDEAAYQIDKMSPRVQELVGLLDEWRQKEVDTQSELLMIRGALRNLQQEMYAVITAERDAAIKAAAAFLPAATAPAAPAANDAPPAAE